MVFSWLGIWGLILSVMLGSHINLLPTHCSWFNCEDDHLMLCSVLCCLAMMLDWWGALNAPQTLFSNNSGFIRTYPNVCQRLSACYISFFFHPLKGIYVFPHFAYYEKYCIENETEDNSLRSWFQFFRIYMNMDYLIIWYFCTSLFHRIFFKNKCYQQCIMISVPLYSFQQW